MKLGERLTLIRKSMKPKMNQTEFAESIGMTRSAYSMYELDSVKPSDSTLKLIELKYRINPDWLEKDLPDEPMYKSQSDSDIETITRAMEGENETKKKLIRIMADMPDELLDKMIDYLKGKLT